MHHQLFIPGEPGDYEQKLCDAGLAAHCAGANWLDVPHGPDEQAGVLYAWPNHESPDHAYQPEKQTWLPAVPWNGKPAKRYYVGIWNDSPPSPDDLEDAAGVIGYRITLGDGNDWLVPTAQYLPADMQLTVDGPKRELKQCYRQFWETSETWFNRLQEVEFNPGKVEAGDATWWDFLMEAMGLTYPHLLPEVASHLRLFDQASRNACLLAVCDWDKISKVLQERQKKKETENESPTPAG